MLTIWATVRLLLGKPCVGSRPQQSLIVSDTYPSSACADLHPDSSRPTPAWLQHHFYLLMDRLAGQHKVRGA